MQPRAAVSGVICVTVVWCTGAPVTHDLMHGAVTHFLLPSAAKVRHAARCRRSRMAAGGRTRLSLSVLPRRVVPGRHAFAHSEVTCDTSASRNKSCQMKPAKSSASGERTCACCGAHCVSVLDGGAKRWERVRRKDVLGQDTSQRIW